MQQLVLEELRLVELESFLGAAAALTHFHLMDAEGVFQLVVERVAVHPHRHPMTRMLALRVLLPRFQLDVLEWPLENFDYS